MSSETRGKPNKLAGYIASIVFNIIFLAILNKVPDWNLSFITESYPNILWAVNLSLGIQIAGNILLALPFVSTWLFQHNLFQVERTELKGLHVEHILEGLHYRCGCTPVMRV